MNNLKTLAQKSNKTQYRYSNWLAQMVALISPTNLDLIIGRGGSKTTDFLAERFQDMAYDMKGAPVVFVADTYVNLSKNVLPNLIQGLKLKGWIEGIHFVYGKKPPSFFNETYNQIIEYKHTFITHTGFNATLVSLDRPSSSGGNSYVHVFGDEVKYFPEYAIASLTKAVRGMAVKYGSSPYYLGHTFTTDMPNINKVSQHNWIVKQNKLMNKKQILLALQAGFVINDLKIKLLAVEQNFDEKKFRRLKNQLAKWDALWRKARKNSSFFFIASSFVNADILTEMYFDKELSTDFEDIATALLSSYPKVHNSVLFYGKMNSKHFFLDGYNYNYYDKFKLGQKIQESSLGLKYINHNDILIGGADFGNMNSLVVGQNTGKFERLLKNFYTITPLWIDDLAIDFLDFFKYHKRKILELHYDRAGNNYNKAKQDFASSLKNSIELQNGKPTGWLVQLKSKNGAVITHEQEFDLMEDIFEERNDNLPVLLIDAFNCKELKSSMEIAPLKKNSKGRLQKDKSSEKLPHDKLALFSTNMSDAFKYYICRPKYLKYTKAKRFVSPNVSVR